MIWALNQTRHEYAPDGGSRGRNLLPGQSVATVPDPIHTNISNNEYRPFRIRRQFSVDAMCSRPPEQTRADNCSRPARSLLREGISERPTGMDVTEG